MRRAFEGAHVGPWGTFTAPDNESMIEPFPLNPGGCTVEVRLITGGAVGFVDTKQAKSNLSSLYREFFYDMGIGVAPV